MTSLSHISQAGTPEPAPLPARVPAPAAEILAAALDSLPDAASVFDHEWRWVYVNHAGREQLRAAGRDPDAVVGRCVWDELPELRATAGHEASLRAVAEGRTVELEEPQPGAERGRWVERRIVPIPGGAVVYTRDVTERHRADAARRESEVRFRRMFVESPLPMWVFDPRSTAILAVNDAALRRYGYTRTEFLQLTLADLRPPEDVPRLMQLVAEPREGTSMQRADLRHRTKDGTVLAVEVTTQDIEMEGAPARLALVLDVTERSRAAERTVRLQAVTAALSGAATPDEVGRIVLERGVRALGAHAGVIAFTTADGRAVEIVASVGYPQGACMGPGRSWPASVRMPITDAARSGEIVLVESLAGWHARYPGGYAPPRANNAAWAALPLTGGNARGALLWTFDDARTFTADDEALMTAVAGLCAQAMERARLYEAERAAREDAERLRADAEAANRAKSDFLATMSHELRTPLNAIQGYAELLALGVRGDVNDAQREDLERIQRSQRHLLSLVNDVLNFARIDAGQVRYDITAVPVAEVVADVGTLVAPQLAAKALTFALGGCLAGEAGDVPTVRADREKLAQILLNLLANAIKFTPEGGRISLACDRATHDGRPTVHLRVADSGIGISPAMHGSIFEPFVQVQRGLTRTSGGTGLGLAISRELARAMQGDVVVHSEAGAGATFTLMLPAG
jgi:PAS domain S-box-containing protein